MGPQGIDQDPFFRLCRDIAPRLGESKPACIHGKFFPALQGPNSKMSSSTGSEATIFMSDSPKVIARKVKKYAFSGGQATEQDHRRYGADIDVDVSFQYLRHIMEDDERPSQIGAEYAAGRLLSGEVKQICIDELTALVA